MSRSPSAAARSGAHDVPRSSATNRMAPVEREASAAVLGERPAPRTVLHVDIDAFFAAIEQQRNPHLRGRPVIVGAGVIASCSYEARQFGLRAGMPLSEAKRRCPEAVILDGTAQASAASPGASFPPCASRPPGAGTNSDEATAASPGADGI